MMVSSSQILDNVIAVLDGGKAEDITVLDLRERCDFADYMVIASSGSGRKTRGLAVKLEQAVKTLTRVPALTEGLTSADWVLVDAGDVVIHIFRPEVRAFYNLEKLWADHGHDDAEHRKIPDKPE